MGTILCLIEANQAQTPRSCDMLMLCHFHCLSGIVDISAVAGIMWVNLGQVNYVDFEIKSILGSLIYVLM